ncbi:unnamed protein product [Prorocentrum cordatum]|uniref:Uncharacterized protein n=1 Tax=Prorocentrum cordatum TaxID=2364126 RepID=A0ABN9SL05_9DINO|nr:unnamed protein product [Polarella glacialis]
MSSGAAAPEEEPAAPPAGAAAAVPSGPPDEPPADALPAAADGPPPPAAADGPPSAEAADGPLSAEGAAALRTAAAAAPPEAAAAVRGAAPHAAGGAAAGGAPPAAGAAGARDSSEERAQAAGQEHLIASLRQRLRRGLQELAACRARLAEGGAEVPASGFGCRPEDHADVLEGHHAAAAPEAGGTAGATEEAPAPPAAPPRQRGVELRVVEAPEDVRELLSGKRVLHVKGFGSGFGDAPEEQAGAQQRQDQAAAQAIDRFRPDYLVVDGDPFGTGFQRYIRVYADRQVGAGLAVPELVWVKSVKGSSPTPEEREKRLGQAREWADQGLPVIVSWLPEASVSEGVDRLFGAGCWEKLQGQRFDFRGAVRLLELAEPEQPEWLRGLSSTAPGRELYLAIKAVEGRAEEQYFERCSFENAAKGYAIYRHLRGEGHAPAAQGVVSFGGGESVLLEFASLYLCPDSGFDAAQAALVPFGRGRAGDPTLPAHEGLAFRPVEQLHVEGGGTAGARGAPAVAAGTAAHATQGHAGSSGGPPDDGEARERERLEEELSMAKALLMLNNVTLNMDLEHDQVTAAQVIELKGSRQLIQLLITLKQKVSLLKQQYLLLRGDMLYLNHEMSVCRHWMMQSFRMAMQHQSQENSSLQTRFERLSKVLN